MSFKINLVEADRCWVVRKYYGVLLSNKFNEINLIAKLFQINWNFFVSLFIYPAVICSSNVLVSTVCMM